MNGKFSNRNPIHQMPKQFAFPFLMKHKVVENLKIVDAQVGLLEIVGSVSRNKGASVLDPLEDQYTVDIDFVNFNGTDIKPVLEWADCMDQITAAAYRNAPSYFSTEEQEPETLFDQACRIARTYAAFYKGGAA